MQENMSELARKYREEMLRLYGGTRQPAAAPPMPETSPMPERPPEPPTPPEPAVIPAPPDEIAAPMEIPAEQQDAPDVMTLEEPVEILYEEPVLPDYVRPAEPLPSPETTYPDYGWLHVAAASGDGAFPVAGAHVTIVQQYNGGTRLIHQMRTDESGETPPVRIPAPSAALSQTPGSVQPYALCDIRIYAKGYFRSEALNVPVFAGITSRQVFSMIPLPLTAHEDVEIIQMLSEAPNP